MKHKKILPNIPLRNNSINRIRCALQGNYSVFNKCSECFYQSDQPDVWRGAWLIGDHLCGNTN